MKIVRSVIAWIQDPRDWGIVAIIADFGPGLKKEAVTRVKLHRGLGTEKYGKRRGDLRGW